MQRSEGCQACETATAARPGSKDGPSKTHQCRKRHTSASNGGCKHDRSYKSVHHVVGTAWRCDSVQTRTAAALCRAAIQQGIFTTQTCWVSCSQRQGLTVPVLCHWHHLPTDHTQLECKNHRNKRERHAKWTYCIHNVYAGRYTRVSCNKQYPTFRGLFPVRDPRFVHLSMSWQRVLSWMWRDRSVKRVSDMNWHE